MGKKSAPATDPRIGAAAEAAQKISGEEWDWFQNTYLPTQMNQQATVADTSKTLLQSYMGSLIPSQEQAYKDTQAAAQQTGRTALEQMGTLGDTGNKIFQTWNDSYAPLYSQIASEAAAKGGKADQDYQAMLAAGDVNQAYANAADSNSRYLSQYGMSPTSGVAQALNRSSDLNQAAQAAAAQTAARQAASNLGWTYRQQAGALGGQLMGQGVQAYTGSQQAGQSAIAANTGTLNAGNALGQTYTGALNTATAPVSSMASIGQGYAQGAQGATGAINQSTQGLIQQQANQAQVASANASSTGSIIGSGIGAAGTVAAAFF